MLFHSRLGGVAQRLELLEHDVVGVEEAVYAVLHARLLVLVQLARRDFTGHALAEADVGEGVDCCSREKESVSVF